MTICQFPGRRAFQIGIICALPLEAEAVLAVFDRFWDDRGQVIGKAPGDQNIYTAGRIGHHNVVLVHMPGKGKAQAASSAANLRFSFPNIRLVLVVGICGAVPASVARDEVILGDVMISEGIVQYDLDRQLQGNLQQKAKAPDMDIRATLGRLQSEGGHKALLSGTSAYLKGLQTMPHLRAAYPGARQDRLFQPTYNHRSPNMTCEECGCNGPTVFSRTLYRETSPMPSVHFGLIASGDTVMKSAMHRDAIAKREGVIAFEMEGAGMWDVLFPSVVIKGAADYADSHKSNIWQRYAAATAAACARAFLDNWHPVD